MSTEQQGWPGSLPKKTGQRKLETKDANGNGRLFEGDGLKLGHVRGRLARLRRKRTSDKENRVWPCSIKKLGKSGWVYLLISLLPVLVLSLLLTSISYINNFDFL